MIARRFFLGSDLLRVKHPKIISDRRGKTPAFRRRGLPGIAAGKRSRIGQQILQQPREAGTPYQSIPGGIEMTEKMKYPSPGAYLQCQEGLAKPIFPEDRGSRRRLGDCSLYRIRLNPPANRHSGAAFPPRPPRNPPP